MNNLTYLNVYRKNNLKQLFTQNTLPHVTSQPGDQDQTPSATTATTTTTTTTQITPNKSLSFSVIEEALQAKAK